MKPAFRNPRWNNWKSPVAWLLVVITAFLAFAAIISFPGKVRAETRVQINIAVPADVIVYDHARRPRPYQGVRSVPNYPYGEVRGVPYDAGGNRWNPSYNNRFQRNCYIYDSWRREYLPC